MNFYAIVCFVLVTASALILNIDNKTEQKKIPVKTAEHSIILNLNHKSDLKLYQTLTLTHYTCKEIYRDLINCSFKFKDDLQSKEYPNFKNHYPLLSYTSKTGKNFKIFKLNDGSTHLEVLDVDKIKIIYSFTSTKNLLKFSKLYEKDIFLKEIPDPSVLKPLVL